MGPFCHTHNYSSLPIHYVDRDHFEKNYVDRARRRRAASAQRRRVKCCLQCDGLGWTFLWKNKNGPELFTTLTTICMGPLVAGRKYWEKEDWSLCSLRIISTECNDTIIGNNILLLNHEFKELVHEHLALFINLLIYV